MDVWDERVAGALAFLRRRLTGEYEVDEFGFDPELAGVAVHPVLRLLYERYFRVEVTGIEHLPPDGSALLVANHSGTVPMDALMLMMAVHDETPDEPAPAPARRRPGVPDAGALGAGPQVRFHARLQPRRGAAAAQR